MTRGVPLRVERVRVPETGIVIEGSFELPALAQLTAEDQVFVTQFIRSHGSIKEMERLFGVSYPTIKGRLNRISERLGGNLVVDDKAEVSRTEILGKLERGEITAKEAAEALRK
jgi:hypothetical protein